MLPKPPHGSAPARLLAEEPACSPSLQAASNVKVLAHARSSFSFNTNLSKTLIKQ